MMIKTPVLVLLAGGKSDRMGFPKGLLDFNDDYWLLEQISRFSTNFDSKVIIGLGFDHELYVEHIPWLQQALVNSYIFKGIEVKAVLNKRPKLGAFSTLQTVLQTIDIDRSVLVQPIDVPILNSQELKKMLTQENDIVLPSYREKNGHPVKLSPIFWRSLLTLDSLDEKARLDIQIKEAMPSKISYCDVSDDAIVENLNNMTAWEDYIAKKSSANERSL